MVFIKGRNWKRFLYVFTFIICAILICFSVIPLIPCTTNLKEETFYPRSIEISPEVQILSETLTATARNKTCNHFNCFDIYKCGNSGKRLSVYIYPVKKYVNQQKTLITLPFSLEFEEILKTIYESPYYVSDPKQACVFVPSIDLLNQNIVDLSGTSQVLSTLPFWNDGRNHLLFNMIPGTFPYYNSIAEVDSGQSMIAGAGFSSRTYRQTHDISMPLYNNLDNAFSDELCTNGARHWFAVFPQTSIHFEYKNKLYELSKKYSEILVLNPCSDGNGTLRCHGNYTYSYPEILLHSTFCIVFYDGRLSKLFLSDAMKSGCIPVIVADGYVMPFVEVVDWKRASIRVPEKKLPDLMNILTSISEGRISEMREQTCYLWERYFSSMSNITSTVLEVLNSRIFLQSRHTYEEWNNPSSAINISPPLLSSTIDHNSQGFTAVILTYDRPKSLFEVVLNLAKAPSLAKILVVWNNPSKAPPPVSVWPKINKPLKILKSKENRLSNRFYPYEEIETNAVLAIDDDIVMLTADELEFGYKVWTEFPDRIVGFPARVHVWDNATQKWKYESEWTNDISMVLTGAAFYHKYYNYLYTNSMPGDIKTWVDNRMNCEDIAMNFLVANVTGKAPVKVTPRKKFKCPSCVNAEMLSADTIHMAKRSECINKFAQSYGVMTLKTVEFRADPVLYKVNVPGKLKQFNSVGSL